MPGFSYGGKGDGTSWSSERGTGPAPGGGSTGNSGNHDNNTSKGSTPKTPAEKQRASIRADKKLRAKLTNMINAARKINSAARLSVIHVAPEGVMVMAVNGLNAEQAKQIGFGGLVMGFNSAGYIGAIGDIETGHSYKLNNREKNNYSGGGGVDTNSFMSGNSLTAPKNYNGWQPTQEKSFIYTGDRSPMLLLTDLTYSRINSVDTYDIHFKFKGGEVTYKVEVKNGDLNNMSLTAVGKGNAVFSADNAKKIVKDFAPVIAESEKDILLKSSEIIISVGDNAGSYLGYKYKTLGKEIASNIKNFQGKNIRSYDNAMRSINKLIANPSWKVNAAERTAIINAWQSFNADDMGNKFAALSKTFKMADYAMKADRIREKSIEGYKTGNWGPLMREVELWVIGGLASSVALGIFSAVLGAMAISTGIPVVAAGLLAIILAGLIGSLIDDKIIDKINNEIIRPAY